jgi:hypothetical protein
VRLLIKAIGFHRRVVANELLSAKMRGHITSKGYATMHLIQLLLPLYDNDKQPFSRADFDRERDELARRFGGITAFRRSPAEGLWQESEGDMSRDEVVIFEVMAEQLDRQWWREYRQSLEKRFRQERIVIRATEFEQL